MRLDEIATVTSGHSFRGSIQHDPRGNGRVIQVKDVAPNKEITWEGLVSTTVKGRKEPNWLQDHDVIFLSRGAHNYSTYLPQVALQSVCSPHFFVVRVHDERFHPGFISWLLNQSKTQAYFAENAVGSGQKNIPINVLKSLNVAALPLHVQRQITDLQAQMITERRLQEELIENREQQLAALAQSLLERSRRITR